MNATDQSNPSDLPEGGRGPPLGGVAEVVPIDPKDTEMAKLEADLSDLGSMLGNLSLHIAERAQHLDGVGPAHTQALLEHAGGAGLS